MKKIFINTVGVMLIAFLLTAGNFSNVLAADREQAGNPNIIIKGENIKDFIPKGWKLNYKTDGDLNKDKLNDFAAVIEQDFRYEQGSETAPKRILLIALGQKDKSYKLCIRSSKAILPANAGGVFGDPFYKGLSIKNGTLVIDFYGGSIDRWGLTYKFRFQNNGWFMIGATVLNENAGNGMKIIEDYNLSTGKEITSSGQDGKKLKTKTVNRGVRKLLNLIDFYPWVIPGKAF